MRVWPGRRRERLTAALVVRSPYVKKGTGESLLRYEVPTAGTDIRIAAEAVNAYHQPWVLGAGLSYRLSEAWSLAADAAFFGWSRYSVTYYDEPLARPFRNVVKAGAGVEYLASARMYGRSARIPFRLGFFADPQPMTTVHSSYLARDFRDGPRAQEPGRRYFRIFRPRDGLRPVAQGGEDRAVGSLYLSGVTSRTEVVPCARPH